MEFALEIVAHGGAKSSPLPLPVLFQARLAARHRIPLKLVIRRYLAAKTVLNDFVFRTAAKRPVVHSPVVHEAAVAHNVAFDRLIASVSDEYERETVDSRAATREPRQVRLIKHLLCGEHTDVTPLNYPFEGHHLGVVAHSLDYQPLLRLLSREFDLRLLIARPTDSSLWAWFGARRPPDPNLISDWVRANWSTTISLGIGEVGRSLNGWRRTHHQARAAAVLSPMNCPGGTRYRDIALLAAASGDPLLLASFREMYLAPMAREGDRGEVLRATLTAYFEAGRKTSFAAASLGVTRQTITNRLRTIEALIDQPIAACADQLDAALQLERCGALRA